MSSYGFDNIDGKKVPQRIVAADETIGDHQGTIHVESGTLTLVGDHSGTLVVHEGAGARIRGRQQGTTSVSHGATVVVEWAIEGTVSVDEGGTVIVEAGAKLAGTLSNDGLVIVRGIFGGTRSGNGEFRLEGAGRIKQPDRVEGNITSYDWTDYVRPRLPPL